MKRVSGGDAGKAVLRRVKGADGGLECRPGGGWALPDGTPVAKGVAERLEAEGHLARLPDGRLGLRPKDGRAVPIETTADVEGERQRVRINAGESVLGWLAWARGRDGRPVLEAAAVAAGEQLRLDWTRARLDARITSTWDATIASGAAGRAAPSAIGPSDAALDARRRLYKALDAVGPELSGILLEVCCLASGLEQAERALSLPVRSGKAVLRLALTRLARHYGFLAPDRPSHRALRHWGAEGYSPDLKTPSSGVK